MCWYLGGGGTGLRNWNVRNPGDFSLPTESYVNSHLGYSDLLDTYLSSLMPTLISSKIKI